MKNGERIKNKTIGAILQEIALLLELKGENPFKIKAYANAARSIETLEEDLKSIIQASRLKEIKGIGDTISKQITELVNTGRSPFHEELERLHPFGPSRNAEDPWAWSEKDQDPF